MCTVYHRLCVLQHNNGDTVQQSNRPAATECSTPTDQRPQSAALQQTSGRKKEDRPATDTRAGSQTNELSAPSLTEQRAKPTRGGSSLSAPSLTEQRVKPTRGGSSLSPVSACYTTATCRHRGLATRQPAENMGVC